VVQKPQIENRLYLRSRRHLYAHLQISQQMSANNAQSTGNGVAAGSRDDGIMTVYPGDNSFVAAIRSNMRLRIFGFLIAR
jgi:hypothetical protein